MKKLLCTALLIACCAFSTVAQIRFQETGALNSLGTGNRWGFAAGDYNRDGFQDLAVSNHLGPFQLLLNSGNGFFIDKTFASTISVPQNSTFCNWGDFNNDHLPDLLIARLDYGLLLYINEVASFRQVPLPEPLTQNHLYNYAAAMADYDNDGDLDIYAARFTEGPYDVLVRNNGDLTFTDVTEASGIKGVGNGKSRSASWADYDRDGDMDLSVIGQRQHILFTNQGNGKFSHRLWQWGEGTSVAWGDYDADGYLDMAICIGHGIANRLLKNTGNNDFVDVTQSSLISQSPLFYSCMWRDFDCDGDLDIIHYGVDNTAQNIVLNENLGNGKFVDRTASCGLDLQMQGAVMTSLDYDQNGFPDLAINDHTSSRSILYRAVANQNNWLRIRLIGITSHVDAIGTTVDCYSAGIRQTRHVESVSSYNGQSEWPLHFGLAAISQADSIFIHWTSGMQTILRNVAANQYLEINEKPTALAHDLEVAKIITPVDRIVTTEFAPCFQVRNIGLNDETNIWAQCIIDSAGIVLYQDFAIIPWLASSDSLNVVFQPWTPGRPALYTMHCQISIVGDQRPGNNSRKLQLHGGYNHDMAIKTIVRPLLHESIPTVLNPEIVIENSGVAASTDFDVVCEIIDNKNKLIYRNTYYISSLASLAERSIAFAPWRPAGDNPFTIRFEINNSPDDYLYNNFVSMVVNLSTGIDQNGAKLPKDLALLSNYPNPFNSCTTIFWQASSAGRLRIRLYDCSGALVQTVYDNRVEAGDQRIPLPSGAMQLASGIYFCCAEFIDAQGGKKLASTKLVLLK